MRSATVRAATRPQEHSQDRGGCLPDDDGADQLPGVPRGRGPGSRWRGWCTGAAGHSGGPGPDVRGVGDVDQGLLALAGSVEHLLGEGALLTNQVLGEVEHRVKDLLGVSRGVTHGAGAADSLQQLVAALTPLLPQMLEVLLRAAGQLAELLLGVGHDAFLLRCRPLRSTQPWGQTRMMGNPPELE